MPFLNKLYVFIYCGISWEKFEVGCAQIFNKSRNAEIGLLKMSEVEYDILVVGAGVAGSSAALSATETAKELGTSLRIVVIDKSDEKEWGGNSRYTTANLRLMDEDNLYPTFQNDIINDSKGMANKEYVQRLALEAVDTVKWIKSKGVNLETRINRWSTATYSTIGPVGGGLEIITKLLGLAKENSVSVLFERCAYELSLTDNGYVRGLIVRDSSGRSNNVSCKAVILAGGGFEGNHEMLTKYIGEEASMLRPDVPATRTHMGECINMALEIGAMPSGQFDGYHGGVVDSRNNGYRPLVNSYPYGILVNKLGDRFVDEGLAEISDSFEIISRSIFKQPEHQAYLILDQKLYSVLNYKNDIKSNLLPIECDSIEGLATKCSIPSDQLVKTVDEFNKAVQFDERERINFFSQHTTHLNPPKSHWASKIDEPPFICYPVEGTIQFTYGGIATDNKARVIATNNAPIRGLYAVGEMVGLSYYRYTAATSVLRSLTYGRIAGFEAVNFIVDEKG